MLLLNSCLTEPSYPPIEPWLCSINADGTGFRKIKKSPFNTPGLVDIYMTKDNRIIFYGEKLWISETDSISIIPITPFDLKVHSAPGLEFTRDGGTAFFAANRDFYQLSMETFELVKITDTPVDFRYAEPTISDDERYLTGRGYSAKSKDAQRVAYYIDLLDYSSGYIYTKFWIPSPYKTKIMTGLNKLFIVNRDGFASVSLSDSTYTLHLPYNADWGNPFQTSADNRFILTECPQAYSRLAIAIDLNDFTRCELGTIHSNVGREPIKACKEANTVFYFNDRHLYKYDLDTHTKSTVLGEDKIGEIYMIAPTWDGSKVHFYADIVNR